jgi:hypothetical protein
MQGKQQMARGINEGIFAWHGCWLFRGRLAERRLAIP